MTGFAAWAVVATDKSFVALELAYEQLGSPAVLALYPSADEAEKGANRAILMREAAEEKYAESLAKERAVRSKLEPVSAGWSTSVAHELALLNAIAMAVHEAAQPRKGKP
jgi:hypothetical protein